MSETFPVRAAEGTALVAPDGAQLVFHGINKSGSFAMSSAMRDAYALAGRDDQFLCHYFIGGSRESFAERVDSAEGPGFFVGHYLYGALKPRPNRVWVTIFRHPLPRMLSCYNWLKNKHERQEPDTPFDPLDEWCERTHGVGHSMVVQFGAGYGAHNQSLRKRLRPQDLYELSIDALERDVSCIGLAERFEESIFHFAALAGLPEVAPWVRDQRNPGRPLSSEIGDASRTLIEEIFEYDFKLYEYALERFAKQTAQADFGSSLEAYKARCEAEYNDRILLR